MGGNPISLTDPTGEFGVIGALGSAGFELAIQLAMNGGDFGCVDWGDVAAAGVLGFFVPKALSEAARFKKAFGASVAYQEQYVVAKSASRRIKIKGRLDSANGDMAGSLGNIAYSTGAKAVAKEIVPPLPDDNSGDCKQ